MCLFGCDTVPHKFIETAHDTTYTRKDHHNCEGVFGEDPPTTQSGNESLDRGRQKRDQRNKDKGLID